MSEVIEVAIRRERKTRSVDVGPHDTLIGIFLKDDEGNEFVRYVTSWEEANRYRSAETLETALGLAGAWEDLDWDEMEAALDRIRHDSPPSPPLTL